MDSPVIVDTASKFGRGIDLDRSFPGFPFDDEGFGRRSNDIRSHLDDLASRHPEFADQLIGPPWGNIPFHGSLRNRRRGSGSSGYQGHPDEDARSQTSGSSAASAASGASGVSSHGDNGVQDNGHLRTDTGRNPIPQYGLRNTVDIGQQRHNMENPDKGRNQRSMSAPPENRQQSPTNQQQVPQEQYHQQQPQGQQRFVSRVDITPQHNQQQQQQQPQQQPQQQQQQPQPKTQPQAQTQQKPQSQSNVRHIPIFVEGRDEPVISRDVNDSAANFPRQPSPPQFRTTSPHFQRPSAFNQQHYGRQWPPSFGDPFYPPHSPFDQSPTRRSQQNYQPPYQQTQPHTHQSRPHERYQRPQRHEEHPHQRKAQQQTPPPQQHQEQQQQQQQEPQPEPPKPKQIVPKDPLERVALIQNDIDALAEQVKAYSGKSRQEKEYMYLDEMLTRELIKLDDIETEGRDNVRQARKNAIKTIQETISLLESKVPIPGQQQEMLVEETTNNEAEQQPQDAKPEEKMEVDEKEAQGAEPIPLPPAPSSPTKAAPATIDDQTSSDQAAVQNADGQQKVEATQAAEQQPAEMTVQQEQVNQQDSQVVGNAAPAAVTEASMEVDPHSTPSEQKEKEQEQEKVNEVKKEVESTPVEEEQKAQSEQKMEVDEQATQSPKSPRRMKKTKKQTPVSDQAIPLPAPEESNETNAK